MLLWRKIKLTFTLKTTIIELVFYSIYKKSVLQFIDDEIT